jgi:hypothetical protein
MAPQRPPVELKSHGSGSGPQTPAPPRVASCGHHALAFDQGQPLSQAIILPAFAA